MQNVALNRYESDKRFDRAERHVEAGPVMHVGGGRLVPPARAAARGCWTTQAGAMDERGSSGAAGRGARSSHLRLASPIRVSWTTRFVRARKAGGSSWLGQKTQQPGP